MSLCRRLDDLNGHRITIEVIDGVGKKPLSAIRLSGISVPSNGALDMSRSLYLIIGSY